MSESGWPSPAPLPPSSPPDTSAVDESAGTSDFEHLAPFDTSPLRNTPALPESGSGASQLLIRGGGTRAVATDEMLATAAALHAIHDQAPSLGTTLLMAAQGLEPGGTIAPHSQAVLDAGDSLTRARVYLDQAGSSAGDLADGMDAAAVGYGNAENAAIGQFLAMSAGATSGAAWSSAPSVPLLGILIALGLLVAGGTIRDALGKPIDPADVEVPPDLNRLISDPNNILLLRLLLMSSDDLFAGIFRVPNVSALEDMEVGAGFILLLGSCAGLFQDARVNVQRTETSHDAKPPGGIEDHANNIPSAIDGDESQVRIDVLKEAGKPDRYEVYIGGTVDFSPLAKDEPFDLTSNVELIAGLPAGAYDGVKKAMAAAGITSSSEVVFTGHSQGGLIAARLAESGAYNVQGLVTFGAPAGGVRIPSDIPTLIVEHDDDVVPALGGIQLNTDAVIVNAMAFDSPDDMPAGVALPAHHIEEYAETGHIIDTQAGSPAVTSVLDALNTFSEGTTSVTSNYYKITRA